MATWMTMDQFRSQLGANGKGDLSLRAANPSEFNDRPENATSFWIGMHDIPWEKKWLKAPLPDQVDIAIIGSGITGAAVAYQVSKLAPELTVAVLESRGICTGATGRNGGHMARPEAYHVGELAKTFGIEDTVRMRRMGLRTRDKMIKIINDEDAADSVDLRLNGTVVVFKDDKERQAFVSDLQLGQENNLQPECYLLSPAEVVERTQIPPSEATFGGAYLDKSGTIYPRKLVDLLFRIASRNLANLTFHPYTPVSEVRSTKSRNSVADYEVKTNKGTLRARAVFHATNAYANHLLPSLRGQDGVFGCKAHVMAIRPNKHGQAPLKQGFGFEDFWHWILQRDEGGPFIYGWSGAEIIGDYDDSITLPEDHFARPEMFSYLTRTFPQHFEGSDLKRQIKFDWTGIQGFTLNGASRVGRPSRESRGEFMSVGHNGEGMGRCFSCAEVATDAMLHYLRGEPDETWELPTWFPKAYWFNG